MKLICRPCGSRPCNAYVNIKSHFPRRITARPPCAPSSHGRLGRARNVKPRMGAGAGSGVVVRQRKDGLARRAAILGASPARKVLRAETQAVGSGE